MTTLQAVNHVINVNFPAKCISLCHKNSAKVVTGLARLFHLYAGDAIYPMLQNKGSGLVLETTLHHELYYIKWQRLSVDSEASECIL